MGRVYKALNTEVSERVAIKPEIAAERQIIERFRNELKLARKVRHQNVCQMFDLKRRITFVPSKPDRYLVHPRYHYLLAKLYEEKGKTAQATQQSRIFLDLWKDADADHPEPPDARIRLPRLQNR